MSQRPETSWSSFRRQEGPFVHIASCISAMLLHLSANWPMDDRSFPVKHGDFPASHVGLPGIHGDLAMW